MAFEKEMRAKFEVEEAKALEAGVPAAQLAQQKWLDSLKREAPAAVAAEGTTGSLPAGPPSSDTKLEGFISEAFVRCCEVFVLLGLFVFRLGLRTE